MTESQKQFFAGHKWKMDIHLNCDDRGVLQYSCEALGIKKLIVTPKTKRHKHDYGEWGVGKVTYHIDGDDREFETLEALVEAKGIT